MKSQSEDNGCDVDGTLMRGHRDSSRFMGIFILPCKSKTQSSLSSPKERFNPFPPKHSGTRRVNKMKEEKQNLSYRQIGRGFIINDSIPGRPVGRRLTKTYVDQFNRKYVLINDRYELLTAEHNYLSVD
jgi:hypothetical protein